MIENIIGMMQRHGGIIKIYKIIYVFKRIMLR